MSKFVGTGRYELIRKIGEGGMGTVYEVLDRDRSKRLALKVMHNQAATALLRFKREFRAIAELHHPGLVKLDSLEVEGDKWFYTMELVDGVELLDALGVNEDGSGCDIPTFIELLPQVIDALEFIHTRGFVHRDLKPDNILIDKAGRVRLVDFGIVKDTASLQKTSQVGEIVGTVAYMAPEQARGDSVGAAADLYALGCVIYHVVTGVLPFSGPLFQLMMAHQNKEASDIRLKVPNAPAELANVCLELMAKDPGDRPTIPEIRSRLGFAHPAGTLCSTMHFVGRRNEIGQLMEDLEEVSSGGLRVVMLKGEAGQGKSMLASQLARTAGSLGFKAYQGRCFERETVPFRAFDRILDELSLTVRSWPEDKRVEQADILEDISTIFPAFESAKSTENSDTLEPGERRARAFFALRRLMGVIEDTSPLLLVMDDLLWTDTESMELLDQLLKGPGEGQQRRLMVLCMARPEVPPSSHPLARFEVRHRDRNWWRRMMLGPMGHTEIEAILSNFMAGPPSPEQVAGVMEQSGGNPFLAGLLVSCQDKGMDMRGLLSAQVSDLPNEARSLLELASASGGVVARSTLRDASGFTGESFEKAVQALVGAQMLRPTQRLLSGSGSNASFEFTHNRLREVVYGGLEPKQRNNVHRRLAEALEADTGTSQAEVLLHHWQGAGEDARARSIRLDAAKQAADRAAFERAADLIEQTLADWEVAPQKDRTTSELWMQVGDLRESSGDLVKAIDAQSRALELFEAAKQTPERLRDLRARLGANMIWAGRVAQGERLIEQALATWGLRLQRGYGASIITIIWLQLLLALWSLVPDGWGRRRQTSKDEAQAAMFQLVLLSAAGTRNVYGAEYNTRLRLLIRRLKGGEARRRGMLMSAIVISYTRYGSTKAMKSAMKMADAAEALGRTPIHLADSISLRGTIAFNKGRWTEAIAHFERALALYEEEGASRRPDCMNIQVSLLISLDNHGEQMRTETLAKRMVDAEGLMFWRTSHAASVLCRLLVDQGRLEEAQATLDAWGPLVPSSPPTYMRHQHLAATHHLQVARGELSSVVEGTLAVAKEVSQAGTAWLPLSALVWYGPFIDAVATMALRGDATARALKVARQEASRVAKKCPDFCKGVGFGALALLDKAAGKNGWELNLKQALRLTREAPLPRHRWQVLRMAKELDRLNDELDRELASFRMQGFRA